MCLTCEHRNEQPADLLPRNSSTFLTGFPFIVSIVTLPERFQIVNGASSLMAGVYLLPLLGASAVGSFLGGAISKSRNNTAYTLFAASVLQLLGVGLLSTLGITLTMPAKQYVFQAILGLGVGMSLSSATIMTSLQARRGDLGKLICMLGMIQPYFPFHFLQSLTEASTHSRSPRPTSSNPRPRRNHRPNHRNNALQSALRHCSLQAPDIRTTGRTASIAIS